ncbi:hypothetical protein [Desulforhopalus singaporensis]|uniref:hypothetical protein n=1 Tax=Desulforhopalus singaporensis TaxID=91360 RepID=UPI0015A38BD9|nr:hypothetical protein [Desulforhopalus singaporensis]
MTVTICLVIIFFSGVFVVSAKMIILVILSFCLAGGMVGGTYFLFESKHKYDESWMDEPVDIQDILIQPGDKTPTNDNK